MIDQATLFTYVAILFGFVLIPGPAVIFTLAQASRSGTKVGVSTGFGIAAGDLVHTAMAVFGLSAIIQTSALAFTIVKIVGATYLLYLGIKAMFTKVETIELAGGKAVTAKQAFRQGAIAEITNPKTAMFFLAFLPQFVKPENGSAALQLTTLGVLFVLIGMGSTLLVAFSAGAMSRFLQRNQFVMRWQGKVVGCIYCALGVRLAFQEK
ncbi:LysE family translocator [Curvivirga aplysinae]|uniref:LysE family translocator n=1 Tax=Curvivirga aplysinae TaxID=2529852 RepID=UPI0012BB7585|nr:LysE family translocator [Curvivirga aplysinae]MTI09136.1 LysE family translocator [Curvivirga aplysinae]